MVNSTMVNRITQTHIIRIGSTDTHQTVALLLRTEKVIDIKNQRSVTEMMIDIWNRTRDTRTIPTIVDVVAIPVVIGGVLKIFSEG